VRARCRSRSRYSHWRVIGIYGDRILRVRRRDEEKDDRGIALEQARAVRPLGAGRALSIRVGGCSLGGVRHHKGRRDATGSKLDGTAGLIKSLDSSCGCPSSACRSPHRMRQASSAGQQGERSASSAGRTTVTGVGVGGPQKGGEVGVGGTMLRPSSSAGTQVDRTDRRAGNAWRIAEGGRPDEIFDGLRAGVSAGWGSVAGAAVAAVPSACVLGASAGDRERAAIIGGAVVRVSVRPEGTRRAALYLTA